MMRNDSETGAGKRYGWRGAIVALGIAAMLSLAACGDGNDGSGDPTQLTPGQADEALSLQQQYDDAVRAQDWPLAAKHADRLRKLYPRSEAMAKVRTTLPDTLKHLEEGAAARQLAQAWNYQVNPAGEGKQYTAMISSHTELDENGQPLSEPDARLVLRVHPDWGKSAYLLLAQTQFACGDPCRLEVTFDGFPTETWEGKQADSGQGPALFIEDHSRFYEKMRKAKVVRIHLPKVEGMVAPALRFDVAGYDAAQLRTEF